MPRLWPLLLVFACSSTAQRGARPIDLQVPVVPSAFVVDGRSQLVYELHVTNLARDPVRLEGLKVMDAGSHAVVTQLTGDAFSQQVAQADTGTPGAGPLVFAPSAGAGTPATDPLVLAPNGRAVIYIDIEIASDGAALSGLEHRLDYVLAGAATSHRGARVSVRHEPPPVLGPPLGGGRWVAVYDPAWVRGHRRVVYALDGRARIPGRFATDWMLLDANGRLTRGDEDLVANWYGYGADVLAVADAMVAAVRDDVAESARLSTHPKHPLQDATGNYVALDLGGGRYAFYEHLKPGSIRVRRGEHVRRGQVIASLGFTGHTTGPHLHFHLANNDSPLGSEGVPFAIDRFDVLGSYRDIGSLGKTRWAPLDDGRPSTRTAERPAPNVVVTFGALERTDPRRE